MTAIASRPLRSVRSPRRRDRLGLVRLHERLDAPGASSVHLAWLVHAGRLVAVKRLHPVHVADELGIARVREHARVAMGVDHPNVVATLGVVRRPDEVFAAMEYVPGASLAEIAEAAPRRLEPHVATAIALDALRGVQASREARLLSSGVPRSVSSDSVLIGEDGRTRVLDFDVPGPRTASEVVDDLPYAPPEQLVRGTLATRYVDPRRDVYGASVVLWETLTGRALFHESTVAATLRKILEGAVPAPSSLAPGIGRALDAIVLRGLARDPRARFESSSAMAFELEKAPRASTGDVSRALAGLDLPCIRRRRALAESVRRREVNTLHFECTRSASKE